MTRSELRSDLYYIVGDWRKVDKIFELFGKLSPESSAGNLIEQKASQVPKYDKSMVVRKEKPKFTPEQRLAAREVLRELGLI